jgi:dGTPase
MVVSKRQNQHFSGLASYAVKPNQCGGRKYKEDFKDQRQSFERDRDRVIHCKAFRRLDKKTQVFPSGSGDHFRTRLTHSLEVAQVARGIARNLGLNEDLAETIGLAHDLGHSPFGHAGQDALNEIMQQHGSHFEHNEQSHRVVDVLEKMYPNFPGLNLSEAVLEGLIKHKTAYDQEGKEFLFSAHLEAQVVNYADEIAYTSHDTDDGLRSEIISLAGLRKTVLWQEAESLVSKHYGKIKDSQILRARVISQILSSMINDLCQKTRKNLAEAKIKSLEDVKKYPGYLVMFSPDMMRKVAELRAFLYNEFYMNKGVEKENKKGMKMIKDLFQFYLENPDVFPKHDLFLDGSPHVVVIKDYISGMTDDFLRSEYNKHLK